MRKTAPWKISGALCTGLVLALGASLTLAYAASSPQEARQVVSNGTYAFELPPQWVGNVAVLAEDNTMYVHLVGHPDVWLLRFEIADEGGELWQQEGSGCQRIQSIAMNDGKRLDVWALNYTGMTAGDAWASAYLSNPPYPGPEAEAIVVSLSTGGAYTADEIRSWPQVMADDSSQTAFDLYRALFDGTIWIES